VVPTRTVGFRSVPGLPEERAFPADSFAESRPSRENPPRARFPAS
jgi:hypothetical protein